MKNFIKALIATMLLSHAAWSDTPIPLCPITNPHIGNDSTSGICTPAAGTVSIVGSSSAGLAVGSGAVKMTGVADATGALTALSVGSNVPGGNFSILTQGTNLLLLRNGSGIQQEIGGANNQIADMVTSLMAPTTAVISAAVSPAIHSAIDSQVTYTGNSTGGSSIAPIFVTATGNGDFHLNPLTGMAISAYDGASYKGNIYTIDSSANGATDNPLSFVEYHSGRFSTTLAHPLVNGGDAIGIKAETNVTTNATNVALSMGVEVVAGNTTASAANVVDNYGLAIGATGSVGTSRNDDGIGFCNGCGAAGAFTKFLIDFMPTGNTSQSLATTGTLMGIGATSMTAATGLDLSHGVFTANEYNGPSLTVGPTVSSRNSNIKITGSASGDPTISAAGVGTSPATNANLDLAALGTGTVNINSPAVDSAAGVASTPAFSLTGAPLTGGTGTTTLPEFYMKGGSTVQPTNWSTAGTLLGINTPLSYAGNVIDIRSNGSASSLLSLNQVGALTTLGTLVVPQLTTTNLSGNFYVSNAFSYVNTPLAGYQFAGSTNTGVRIGVLGAGSAALTVGANYSGLNIGSSPVTTPATGTDAWLTNLSVNPIGAVTSGGAAITNTADIYVGAPSTAGTNNYSLYVAGPTNVAGALTTSTVNGVALSTAGSVSAYLNGTGNYTIPVTTLNGGTGALALTSFSGSVLITPAGNNIDLETRSNRRAIADANATVAATDYIIAYTSITAPRVISVACTLGTASSPQQLIIKDESGNSSVSNTITITPTSGTIDGATSKIINSNYGLLKFYANGSNCFTY